MIKKYDATLVFIGIAISAYMTMFYDIVRDLMNDPYANIAPIAVAGLISLGVGSLVFYIFIRGKTK